MRSNKNAPRFREALCVLRVPFYWLLPYKHKCLTVGTGGSCGHGHMEVSRVHVGQYSMREWRRGQEAENFMKERVFYDVCVVNSLQINAD